LFPGGQGCRVFSNLQTNTMSEEKTFEIFAEIAELLRSARSEDTEGWQFHPVLLKTIADKTKTVAQDIETILITISNFEQ
jgi:hypothetical protein